MTEIQKAEIILTKVKFPYWLKIYEIDGIKIHKVEKIGLCLTILRTTFKFKGEYAYYNISIPDNIDLLIPKIEEAIDKIRETIRKDTFIEFDE